MKNFFKFILIIILFNSINSINSINQINSINYLPSLLLLNNYNYSNLDMNKTKKNKIFTRIYEKEEL